VVIFLKSRCRCVRRLSVPLLPLLQGDYPWKHKCYWWRKNASVILDVRLRL
jgi:hypothetical protein